MTVPEWKASTHTLPMIDALEGLSLERPLRQFACACCRRMWELLPGESRLALEVAERYAEGLESDSALAAARNAAVLGYKRADRQISYKKRKVRTQARASHVVIAATSPDAWRAARDAAMAIVDLFGEQPAALLREFVGEPFVAAQLPAL
jgi:hypothetical protein